MRNLRLLLSRPLTLFSVLTGVAVYAWSVKQGVPKDASLLLSLQPVVIGLVLEVFYEVLKAQAISRDNWELFRLKENSPRLFKFVSRIVDVWSDERHSQIPFAALRQLVEDKVDHFTSEVEGFSAGTAQFDSAEWFGIDIEMMRCAEKEVLAVSHAEVSSIWNTPSGRNYWQVNEERIKLHSVACTRIFVLSTQALSPDQLASVTSIMKEQEAAGARILVGDKASIESRLCRDYVIIDKSTCSRLIWTSTGDSVGVELTWNERLLGSAVRDFELLARKSVTLQNYLSSLGPAPPLETVP